MPTKPCAQLRSVEGIQYELVRKKVKQLHLRVRSNGTVMVSIPLTASLEQADRFVVVVDQRPAGHHLTDCETGPVLRHQAAAGRIGEACHGAEHGPVGQGDVLDLQRFHCVPLLLDKTIKNYYTTNRERRWLQNGQLLLGSGVKKNDRLLW